MSAREDRLKTIVTALYAATGRGDWATAEALLTDDFFISEASNHPMAGIYRGKGALRELYGLVMGRIDVAGLEIQEMTAGGEYVVVILDMILGGPDAERVGLAEVSRFRGDQVCEIKPHYFDSTPLRKALRTP